MALSRRRLHAALGFLALSVLVAALALARFVSGPWYVVYAPQGAELVDAWPAAWEALYYARHLPTFLGDGPVPGGIAPVQYRTLLNLYLAALLTGWTGSPYWSLALVDVGLWIAGSLAAFSAMRRLGATPLAAGLGAFLTAASPILVSNMWRHDLHAANFATMALGLWAALALVDDERRPLRLGLTLGALYLMLSLSYQYQWILLPIACVLLRARARLEWRQVAAVTGLSLVVFALSTVLVRGGLDVVGLQTLGAEATAVRQPEQLVLGQLTQPAAWSALLPTRRHLEMTLQAYHPVVFLIGALGLVRIGGATGVVALVAGVASLGAIVLYPAPWTAMSAYPFIYLGAGAVCAETGRRAAAALTRWRPSRWFPAVVAALGALVLAALTNGDLWGDYRFLLSWWRLYFQQAVF